MSLPWNGSMRHPFDALLTIDSIPLSYKYGPLIETRNSTKMSKFNDNEILTYGPDYSLSNLELQTVYTTWYLQHYLPEIASVQNFLKGQVSNLDPFKKSTQNLRLLSNYMLFLIFKK